MSADHDLTSRFALKYIPESHRRVIAGKEVIVHCHHYNSRIQSTIEGAKGIDGRRIITQAAEITFAEQLRNVFTTQDTLATKWQVAAALYSHSGFGVMHLDDIAHGVVRATASHFVEGWNAGFPQRKEPVCTFACGCIQGMVHAVTGTAVYVREKSCMISGAKECIFEIDRSRKEPVKALVRRDVPTRQVGSGYLRSENVDEDKLIDAVVGMPIFGNQSGLIPAFGVYLANTQADFYNQACMGFVEEMEKKNLFSTARKLLVFDAETCGMNTFRGIMSSAEWEGLVKPMIKDESDNLFGIVAISNALGWGNWHVKAHKPGHSVVLESRNGYEAMGYRMFKGVASSPQCFMLTGVGAGLMELLYGEGSVQERFGTFIPAEKECMCSDHAGCLFEVERA